MISAANFIQTIPLSPVEQILLLALGVSIMFFGRHEWGLGFHLSAALWTRNFFVGGVPNLWFLSGITLVALLVDLHRRRAFIELPSKDRWIVVSMGLWLVWILLLMNTFNPPETRSMYRNLLLYTILPIVSILVFARDVRRIRGFAVAFILATLLGAWKTLGMINVDLAYLLSDPTLNYVGVQQLGLYNYHWFAYTHAISLILTVGLFMQVRGKPWLLGLLLAAAVIHIYFLLLAGSRQALNGAVLAALPMVLWALTRRRLPHTRLLVLVVCTFWVGLTLFTLAPHLIVRDNEKTSDALNIFGDRGQYWVIGWDYFKQSPIWGHGFRAKYVHNLIISTLANMGVVGFFFQISLIYFIIKQCRRMLQAVGSVEQAAWRVSFAGIVLFGHIHGMASGDIFSVWHIFWSGTMLWVLRELADQTEPEPEQPLIPLPTCSVAARPAETQPSPV